MYGLRSYKTAISKVSGWVNFISDDSHDTKSSVNRGLIMSRPGEFVRFVAGRASE